MLPLCCEVLGWFPTLSAQYTLQPCISFFDLRCRKLLLEPRPDLFAPCDEISRLVFRSLLNESHRSGARPFHHHNEEHSAFVQAPIQRTRQPLIRGFEQAQELVFNLLANDVFCWRRDSQGGCQRSGIETKSARLVVTQNALPQRTSVKG